MKRLPLLILMLLLPSLLAFRPTPQISDLTVQVSAGIGGWYRPGQWIPLQINVQSQNTTLDGELRVRVGRLSSTATQFETTYSTPFNITSGGSKRVFLYVSLDDYSSQVQVELVDGQGRVAALQQASLKMLGYEDVLQVVVTDASIGVLDVTRHPLGRGRNYQSTWRIADLPANADALRSIDLLYFSDVDTGTLSPAQRLAIADWVRSGGHLVVTGGANWQRTTSGLADILPTEAQETLTLADISALGDFIFQPNESLATDTLVSASRPKANSQVLLSIDETPIIVRGSLGSGLVDFVAIDATTEPLRSWDELSWVWQELALSAPLRPSWTHGIERFELAKNAVSNVTGFDLPSILQLGAFLMAYILLIGPANYLLLNLLGQREWAWFTIPLLILVFSGFAYFTGFSLRGNDVNVNQVSVIQTWEGQDRARVDSVIGILSPRRTSYDVVMNGEVNLRTLPNVGQPTSLSQLKITEGAQYIAEDIPVDAAIMTNFASSGSVPAPDFDGEALITLRGEGVNPRLTGQISNRSALDLQDAIILIDDRYIELGDLDAGQSQTFELILSFQQPTRRTLGSRLDPSRPIINYSNASSFTNQVPCYVAGGLNVVYENVMAGKKFDCSGSGGGDREARLRRRALMLAAMNNEIDRNGGRGLRAYLLGWSEEAQLDIQIPQMGQFDDGTSLFIYEIPTRLESLNPNNMTIPPGMFSWTLIEQDLPNRLPEVAPHLGFTLTAEQGVAVRFTPLPEVPRLQASRAVLEVAWRFNPVPNVEVLVWDWVSQEWQALEFTDENQTRFIIEDTRMIGPHNAVQVLVLSQSAASYYEVEGIRVTLQGAKE